MEPGWLERAARVVTARAGSSAAFGCAVAIVIGWARPRCRGRATG
jgi:hypothetical protein